MQRISRCAQQLLSPISELTMSFAEDSDDEEAIVVVGEEKEEENEDDNDFTLTSIWDDDMVTKYVDVLGKKKWKCGFCKKEFFGWNVTKAVLHVSKIVSCNISICRYNIPSKKLKAYRVLCNAKDMKSNRNYETQIRTDDIVNQNVNSTAQAIIEDRARKRQKRDGSGVASMDGKSLGSGEREVSLNSKSTEYRAKTYRQKTIHTSVSIPLSHDVARVAIADCVHSLGLPFACVDHPKFRYMLACQQSVGTNFKYPNRQQVGGELLEINYSQCCDRNMKNLMMDAHIFGLTAYGDGATVKGNPFVNILASGGHCYAATLQIADCTGQMTKGGKKDARYIANSLFLPHYQKLDPGTFTFALFCVLLVYIYYYIK
jgi:hypothetical protein